MEEGVNYRPAPDSLEKWNGNDGIYALKKGSVPVVTAAAICEWTCPV